MLRKLLKMGADVCAKTDDGKRALHRTAFKGHHEVVWLPLEHEIEVDEENGNEQTAWHYASTNG
jgi:ankyrin repeat protein